MSEFQESKSYPWALTGIFAAFHLIITLIPFSLSVSGTGFISFGMISATIVGFLLGPFFGPISVLIGSYLGIFMNPEIAILGFATPIATAGGALAAGLIRSKKPFIAILIYAVSMVVYVISPLGFLVPEFLWFHIIVFSLSLLFVIPFTKGKIEQELELSKTTSTRTLILLALVSVCIDQAIGSAIGPYYLIYVLGLDVNLVASFWIAVVFIYPVERIIGAIIITFLLGSISESISSGYFQLPGSPLPQRDVSEISELTET